MTENRRHSWIPHKLAFMEVDLDEERGKENLKHWMQTNKKKDREITS